MPDTHLSNSPIIAAYAERTRKSAGLFRNAQDKFPGGLVHDSRRMSPHPIYVDRAEGSRKWDVDGNEYIDFYGGHGSLLLGHAHPSLVAAVNHQIARGTHPAACHELELDWAELVQTLIHSAERVRFTSSGTEANLLAIRLARAFTGKTKLVRFQEHFHGWQDHVAFGSKYTPGTDDVPGVLRGIIENVIVADPSDAGGTREMLESRDDIAAVILEPTGASSGQVPMRREFVKMVRAATAANGILLIFDEVVTGFRVSPGGVQAAWGIFPDITGLAKILAGGLPGGAIVGRRDIMELLDYDIAEARGFQKISHHGTYNANPLAAAAGKAMLSAIAEGDVTDRASAQGEKLRQAWNAVFAAEDLPWAAYGLTSTSYLFMNPDGLDIDPLAFDQYAHPAEAFLSTDLHPARAKLRLALMLNGVDVSSKPGAIMSAVHSDDDIAETAEAMRKSIHMLKEEGAV